MSPLAATVPLAKAVPSAAGLVLADSDKGKGSPIGLFVVLLLLVATYLLYRSMSRHLRRLPERFPGYQPEAGDAGDDGAGVSSAGVSGAGVSGAGVSSAGVSSAGVSGAGVSGAGTSGAGVSGAGTSGAGESGAGPVTAEGAENSAPPGTAIPGAAGSRLGTESTGPS